MRGIAVDANRFRQIRQARGLTQRELASLSGVSERTVRNLEAGLRVRLEFLKYLSVALGVEVCDIVAAPDELRIATGEAQRVEHLFLAIDAQMNGDFNEWVSLLDPKVLYRMPGPEEIPFLGEYRGVDGFRTFIDRSVAALTYERVPEIQDIRSGGDLVVLNGIDRFRANCTGKSFQIQWMNVYEFEKGHIVRIDSWGDVAAAKPAFQPG